MSGKQRSGTAALWIALVVSSSLAAAQGLQTGTLNGIVRSPDGLGMPGVSVTAKSPVLQGERTATTDVNGVYFIKGLPAGTYTVDFTIASFQPAHEENVELPLGGTAEVNPTLNLSPRAESVTV